MTRPYIVEALVPVPGDMAGECPVNACCPHTFRLWRILKRHHAWIDPEELVVSEVDIGENWWRAGELWVRALVHARVPLEEVVKGDGENLVIRATDGELFQAENQCYYVTRDCVYTVDGVFVLEALRQRDDDEIPDIRDFLMPLILAELQNRIMRLMQLESLPAEAAELIEGVTTTSYHRLQELLDIDTMDIQCSAEIFAERLRNPGDRTTDLADLPPYGGCDETET